MTDHMTTKKRIKKGRAGGIAHFSQIRDAIFRRADGALLYKRVAQHRIKVLLDAKNIK